VKPSVVRKADRMAKERAPQPRMRFFWRGLDKTANNRLEGTPEEDNAALAGGGSRPVPGGARTVLGGRKLHPGWLNHS
jgi:hypothetical protein